MKKEPKVVLLKGNGPISINNELLELLPVTTCHGAIGFPLKSLRCENLYIITDLEEFWEIEKKVTEKPACFLYTYDGLKEEDFSNILTQKINSYF